MSEYKFFIDGFETIVLAHSYSEAVRKLRDDEIGMHDNGCDQLLCSHATK